MRQLQLFTTAALAEMRDRTASRNHSPAREEFRREHARHRAWGLVQRHGERLRRRRRQPCARDPAPRCEQVGAEVAPPARSSQPTQPEHAARDHHTRSPRPPTPAGPSPARVPPRRPPGSRPQPISHLSKRRHRASSTIWAEGATSVPRRLTIRRSDRPPKEPGKVRVRLREQRSSASHPQGRSPSLTPGPARREIDLSAARIRWAGVWLGRVVVGPIPASRGVFARPSHLAGRYDATSRGRRSVTEPEASTVQGRLKVGLASGGGAGSGGSCRRSGS
jgi:hypothetical protein